MADIKVLFVCLGNICRSPAAEAVMTTLVKQHDLADRISCDSAGTSGNHEGEPADPRTIAHAKYRGHTVTSISRRFNPKEDFIKFDYILAMDDHNFEMLRQLDSNNIFYEKIFKMTDFATHKLFTHVPDPYYEGPEAFETVMDILEDACLGLLEKIKASHIK